MLSVRTRFVVLLLPTLAGCNGPDMHGNPDSGTIDAGPDAGNSCSLDGGVGVLCSGACVNIQSDPAHCGSCTHACAAGEACVAGACQAVAVSLDGLQWKLPCENPAGQFACTATNPPAVTATLQGSPGASYDITLQFRGVVETKAYVGGTNDGRFWQVGGTPTGDTWNWYRLQISSPSQTYYLNRGASGLFYCYGIDYQKTVRMNAGATVTLSEDTVDGQEIINRDPDGHQITVSGVSPSIAQPYNGQFIEMQVISVIPAP